MSKLTIKRFNRFHKTLILTFSDGFQLALVTAVDFEFHRHKWLKWKYTETRYIAGLREIILLNNASRPVVIYAYHAAPFKNQVELLDTGYRQRRLARYLQFATEHVREFYGEYPKELQPLLEDIETALRLAQPALEDLSRSRAPVTATARPTAPRHTFLRVFPGRIGGLHRQ